jgi:hypothetical protein
MVSSRTVEAPCSFNEDTFPREKSVETLISMGVPLSKQTEIISSDCVRKASSAHKGLPSERRNSILINWLFNLIF